MGAYQQCTEVQTTRREEKFRSVSVISGITKRTYEYEEDLNALYSKCGQKVVQQAQNLEKKHIVRIPKNNDNEKYKQQIKEIFQSLYTSNTEKRINVKNLMSDRPESKKIDWIEYRRRLPQQQLGTIHDPLRFQNLYDKFNKEIEAHAPSMPFQSFRHFLQERRNHQK